MPMTVHAVLRARRGSRSCPSRSRRRAPARPARARACVHTSSSLASCASSRSRAAAREDRAAVGHRLVEEQREELVRDVVVVADRARVALAAVAAPARAQLGRRHRRRRRIGPHRARARRARAAAARARSIGGGFQLSSSCERRVEVVDLELAAHVGAAEPELAGRAQHVRERRGRAHVKRRARRRWSAAARVPSQNVDRERALGQGARSSRRSGSVRAQRPAQATSAAALRGLALRADAHDVPGEADLLEPPDHPREGSSSPAPHPVLGGGRERVVVVVPRLAERERRQPRRGCATRRRCRSACRPKKWQSELML